jgi:hypothetical protein
MKIETYLHPNCSDYTISLWDLKPDSASKIKDLENDLKELYDWSRKERTKLPKEPNFGEPDVQKWSAQYTEWRKLKSIKKFGKEEKKRWEKLRKKYVIANGEDIFDTTINGFHWMAPNVVTISGYLNVENLATWLEDVAKVDKIKVDSE